VYPQYCVGSDGSVLSDGTHPKSDEAVSIDRLEDLRQAWLSGRIQQGPGQPGEPDGDQEPLRRRMMDLVVGRDRRRSTPKLDNRDGRGHYLKRFASSGDTLIVHHRDRPQCRRNEYASQWVARMRWMPRSAAAVTSARVSAARLASSTPLRLAHSPSTGLSSGA
jgi:hypothetical protein